MSERDHQLVAARRTCALLSRDQMLDGKVPTTATSASVVAALQTQEAVKLLHVDRLGEPALAGGGYHFVGLTHDSYVVTYGRRDDCLSHDTYELAAAGTASPDEPLDGVLARARELLGTDAVIELEHEIVSAFTCAGCGTTEAVRRPVHAITAGAGVCPTCDQDRAPQFLHTIDGTDGHGGISARELGLPADDVLVARVGFERRFFRLREDA